MSFLSSDISRFAALLLALGMLVQALLPGGFMPAVAADGRVEIVICTSKGPATILADFSDRGSHDEEAPLHDSCPYAPVLAYAMTAAPGLLSGVMSSGTVLLPDAAAAYFTTARKPWLAQAPPALS